MNAKDLYHRLEEQFVISEMTDDWNGCYDGIFEFVCDSYKQKQMGLVCDFTDTVNKVYTAVFPSEKVMNNIIKKNIRNAMLFVHHPATWDIRNAPNVFIEMDSVFVEKFRERNISIFNYHVPLDNYGRYSTSVSLSKALGVNCNSAFGKYFGAQCGVFGEIDEITTISDLQTTFESCIGHEVMVYKYGDQIFDGNVAVVAGGGLSETIEEIVEAKVKVLITGIAAKNSFTQSAHEYAQKNNVTILAGTHYSTEKFACIEVCDFFNKFGLQSEFIDDLPVFEDM
ncbi:Hypothetical protein CHISP_2956 [Chitinispirillum alkaliphilum]|nr:Hypothetical protein CHISP_2956 [Chitinispirillum alkaliphilum]